MTLAFRFRMILVGGAGVKDLVIVKELDVAGLQHHVEAHIVTRR